MPEIVFIHCQTFSRKPNAIGQCVTQVIGEGLRTGGFHLHVANPKPPIPVFGTPSVFQKMHDTHIGQHRTTVMRNGSSRERAIRQDRHTLFTIVASYPVPTGIVEGSTEELARFKKWVDLTLSWVQDQYGNQLKVAFTHVDEQYPHLHFWLLPDHPSCDATLLHPGKVAKRSAEAGQKSAGTTPQDAVKAGNRALQAAMRDWIDSYHIAVGAPLGMCRDGPKRRRLSRAQHQAELAMAAHHRSLEDERMRLEARVATLKEQANVMVAQKLDLEMKAAAFMERAERHLQRMRAEIAQVSALDPMLDALISEIMAGTVTFNSATGWKVRDPAPFVAAGKMWIKIEPAVRRLIQMLQTTESGGWIEMQEKDYSPIPAPADLSP